MQKVAARSRLWRGREKKTTKKKTGRRKTRRRREHGASMSAAPISTTDAQQRVVAELEFVQRLANPEYLHYLAQTRQLDDEAFVRYLDYLQYWRKPEYAQHIAFPHCLHFLKLLQDSTFRDAMKRPDFKDFIAGQQHAHWRYRLSILDEAREEMRAQVIG